MGCLFFAAAARPMLSAHAAWKAVIAERKRSGHRNTWSGNPGLLKCDCLPSQTEEMMPRMPAKTDNRLAEDPDFIPGDAPPLNISPLFIGCRTGGEYSSPGLRLQSAPCFAVRPPAAVARAPAIAFDPPPPSCRWRRAQLRQSPSLSSVSRSCSFFLRAFTARQ